MLQKIVIKIDYKNKNLANFEIKKHKKISSYLPKL